MLVFLPAANLQYHKVNYQESINPDWPRGPIQSERCHVPVRNAVTGKAGSTERRIKSQFVELVAEISVESPPQRAMQPSAEETVAVTSRIVGGAGALRCTAVALAQLLHRQRLQTAI